MGKARKRRPPRSWPASQLIGGLEYRCLYELSLPGKSKVSIIQTCDTDGSWGSLSVGVPIRGVQPVLAPEVPRNEEKVSMNQPLALAGSLHAS